MLLFLVEKAERHFERSTKKVYQNIGHGQVIPFAEFLRNRYTCACYYYSTSALMGLKNSDRLVRGYQTASSQFYKQQKIQTLGGLRQDYNHGWVEFDIDGETYIFDSGIKTFLPKNKYYRLFWCDIDYIGTKEEILNEFFSDKYCRKDGEVWTIKDYELPRLEEDPRQIAILPYSRFQMNMNNKKPKIQKAVMQDVRGML